jgi:hypothetical protein
MGKRKTVNVNEYGVNPFVAPLVIPVTRVISPTETRLVDRRFACRIYQSVTARELLCTLSGMGSKLVLFIAQQIEPGKDYIRLEPAQFMDICGVKSAKSMYTAINELHDRGIINPIRGKRAMYWINPAILFCGSAAAKYPDNVVIKQTWKK